MARKNSTFIQHIAFIGFRNAALGGDLVRQLLNVGVCTSQQRDLRAALRQRSGKFTAEHAARASHDRYLSGQIRFYRKFHHNHPFYQGPAFLY